MDPNANLLEQERLIVSITTDKTRRDYKRHARHANRRLSELRQALYDWVRDGGFEPDWSKAPNASIYYGKQIG